MKDKKLGISQKATIYNDEDKILLVRRGKTAPTRAEYWDLPGGILEIGEDPKEAIKREVKEETGLILENFVIIDSAQWNEGDYSWVTNCYKVKTNSDKVILSFEHDDFTWADYKKIDHLKVFELHKRFIDTFKNVGA